MPDAEQVDVAIIGGGPAGLAAAAALAARGDLTVVVIERESEAGGIPRHANHPGFGIRDLHRFLSGPEYARRMVERATRAGAEIRTRAQVTGVTADRALEITSQAGRSTLHAGATVLATGCRERPRSARLIPGSRPLGSVMTTGQLQQAVYLQSERFDRRRAVIVGAEHVSYSALQTLNHAGARCLAMTTEHGRHQSFALFAAGARLRYRAPLHVDTRVAEIGGTERLEWVLLENVHTGAHEQVRCDLLLLTADWIPDHELAVLAGARLDPGTRGPVTDGFGRSTVPGLFAAGNVLHGAETADIASLNGVGVAASVRQYLDGSTWPQRLSPILCEPPLDWIVPEGGSWRVRSQAHIRSGRLEISQGGRIVERTSSFHAKPGRSATVKSGALNAMLDAEQPITIRLVSDGSAR